MCRLYGFRSNEPTKVECTLVRAQNALLFQSRADRRGTAHEDGWGIGFYKGSQAQVEKRVTAAHQDRHFGVAAERVYSTTVVAHVRRATVGGSSQLNSHPFLHGRWVFAHNGTIAAFERVRPLLERQTDPALLARRRGETDSELAFYWLLSRMQDAGIAPDGGCADVSRLAEVLSESVLTLESITDQAGADQPSKLNFLLTDGAVLVVSRWGNSLYWVSRKGIRDCEICGIPHIEHADQVDYRAVVVASEPISQEPWREVSEGSVLSVNGDVHAELYPA